MGVLAKNAPTLAVGNANRVRSARSEQNGIWKWDSEETQTSRARMWREVAVRNVGKRNGLCVAVGAFWVPMHSQTMLENVSSSSFIQFSKPTSLRTRSHAMNDIFSAFRPHALCHSVVNAAENNNRRFSGFLLPVDSSCITESLINISCNYFLIYILHFCAQLRFKLLKGGFTVSTTQNCSTPDRFHHKHQEINQNKVYQDWESAETTQSRRTKLLD